MSLNLRNTQQNVKPPFAYYAMADFCATCKPAPMRIRLKEFRDQLGLTLEQMAERSGFSVSQLSRWESGGNNIPSARLPELARHYECRIADIFDEGESPFRPLGPTLYVKGVVAAGVWREAWEMEPDEWETYTGRADINAPLRDRFGLRVEGDSMNEIYPAGTILDCITFRGDYEITNGKRVIVQRLRNGDEFETTVKEYFKDPDGIEWLIPRSTNPAFQRRYRVDEQADGMTEAAIIGVVVGRYLPE